MIRRARIEDASDLASVHINTWQHAYRKVFPADFLESLDLERREVWFASQIEKDGDLLVAEAGGRAVGFCLFGSSDEEGWGEIFAIYVLPQRWGEGHGYRLLRGAERDMAESGLAKALLWVLDSNRVARAFYQRQGWSLGKPIRIEEIGGTQVTEVRYERFFE